MKSTIILLSFLLALPFIVNVPDAKLLKEAEKIIASPPATISPQTDNGFYALLGFQAPFGKEIHVAGKEVYVAYSGSLDSNPPEVEFSPEKIIGPSPEMPDPKLIPRCMPDKKKCLRYYAEQEEQLVRLLEQHASLMERYKGLKKYAFFQDTTKSGSRVPQVEGAIYAGHLLTAGEAAVLFNKGRHEEAVDLLVADIILWRKLLAGSTGLSGKTYSLIALRLTYSLLDEMIDIYKGVKPLSSVNVQVLAPLSTQERSTDLLWDRHFRTLAWSISKKRWPPDSARMAKMSFLERAFVKTNATLNDAFEMFQLLKKLSTAEPNEIENLQKDFSQRREEISKIGLYTIYNPLGKKFISSAFDEGAGVAWNGNIDSLDQLTSRIRDKIEK